LHIIIIHIILHKINNELCGFKNNHFTKNDTFMNYLGLIINVHQSTDQYHFTNHNTIVVIHLNKLYKISCEECIQILVIYMYS